MGRWRGETNEESVFHGTNYGRSLLLGSKIHCLLREGDLQNTHTHEMKKVFGPRGCTRGVWAGPGSRGAARRSTREARGTLTEYTTTISADTHYNAIILYINTGCGFVSLDPRQSLIITWLRR